MSRASCEQFARLGSPVGATKVGRRARQALKQSFACQVIAGVSGAKSPSWQTAVPNEKKIRRQTSSNPCRYGRRLEGRTNELSVVWAFSIRTIIDVLSLSTNTFSSSTSAEELREITDNQIGSCRRRSTSRQSPSISSAVLSEKFVPLLTHMALPAYALWVILVCILDFLGFDKAFLYRTVNSGSRHRRVPLLTFVCGTR